MALTRATELFIGLGDRRADIAIREIVMRKRVLDDDRRHRCSVRFVGDVS